MEKNLKITMTILILVLKKNRALTDKVIMIDAEEMCHKTRRETIFTEEDIEYLTEHLPNNTHFINKVKQLKPLNTYDLSCL